jgi:hypothetical protein
MYARQRCTDCVGGIFDGPGKCSKCDGTGVNTQLNSAEPKCPYCHGTGVCGTCNGSGFVGGADDQGGDIITLNLE